MICFKYLSKPLQDIRPGFPLLCRAMSCDVKIIGMGGGGEVDEYVFYTAPYRCLSICLVYLMPNNDTIHSRVSYITSIGSTRNHEMSRIDGRGNEKAMLCHGRQGRLGWVCVGIGHLWITRPICLPNRYPPGRVSPAWFNQ